MNSRVVDFDEGLDLHDPYTRQRFENRVKANLGQAWECLYPRPGERTTSLLAVDTRPGARRIELPPGAKPTQGSEYFAKIRDQYGLQLVEFEPHAGYAIACNLDGETVSIRNRLATVLKCDPWAIEVVTSSVFDETLGQERLDKVCVVKAPMISSAADKRLQVWRDLVATLRGGSTGWHIDDDPVSGQVQLSYGQPRKLPDSIAMADLMPATVQPDDWYNIPLGVGPAGNVVGVDLRLAPMGLVVGPTGAGKSVELRQHAASALARGHSLIIIDTNKSGLDFMRFRPWTVAWGGTLLAAEAILNAAYDEGQRRKSILERYETPSWVDLPVEVRQRENIVPATIMIDEFMSMALPVPVPKGVDKDHPALVEANELNAIKATILSKIGKIARELRFSGIFMVLATQRPDASQLPGFGEIRSNLTGTVQLIKPGSIPATETLRMIFPGEQTAVAADTFRELDDGRTLGIAASASEGGDVKGFRVAFAPIDAIQPLLESIDIPKPEPWKIPGVTSAPKVVPPKAAPAPEPEFTVLTPIPPAEEIVVSEMSFSLDDLEAELEGTAPAVVEDDPFADWDFASNTQVVSGAAPTPTSPLPTAWEPEEAPVEDLSDDEFAAAMTTAASQFDDLDAPAFEQGTPPPAPIQVDDDLFGPSPTLPVATQSAPAVADDDDWLK